MKKIKIAEFNIIDNKTGGHYLERAVSLSQFYKDLGYSTTLLCGANRNITKNEDLSSFDCYEFMPSFTTFMHCNVESASLHDKTLLRIFDEVKYQYDLIGINSSAFGENKKILELIGDKSLYECLCENLYEFYTVLPLETLLIVYSILRFLGFKVRPPKVHAEPDFRKMELLWFRVRRESNAFYSGFFENVIDRLINANENVIFTTANIDDAICAAKKMSNADDFTGVLSFILHQPSEVSTDKSYKLKSIYQSIPLCKKKNIKYFAASNEFKHLMTSNDYNLIGDFFDVSIGPFRNLMSDRYPKNTNINLKSKILHQLQNSKIPKWLIQEHKPRDSFEKTLTSNFTLLSEDRLFKLFFTRLVSQGKTIISFLGDIRDEKAFDNFVKLVIMSWDMGIELYAVYPSFFSNGVIENSKKYFEILSMDSRSKKYGLVYNKHLPIEIYSRVLTDSSIIFNSYAEDEYLFKQSGVFYESLLYAKTVLVSIRNSSSIFYSNALYLQLTNARVLLKNKPHLISVENGRSIVHEFKLKNDYLVIEFDPAISGQNNFAVTVEYNFIDINNSVVNSGSFDVLNNSIGVAIVKLQRKFTGSLRIELLQCKNKHIKGTQVVKFWYLPSAKHIDVIYNQSKRVIVADFGKFDSDMCSEIHNQFKRSEAMNHYQDDSCVGLNYFVKDMIDNSALHLLGSQN